MKLPRSLSGAACAAVLIRQFGYRRVHQSGSHIVLQTEQPKHHRLAVPAHTVLRVGTLEAILRSVAAAQGVDKAEVLKALLDRA